MSTLELLRGHVSVRDFLPEAVPEEELEALLRTAQQCSTDATGQLYSLIRVRPGEPRSEIARLVGQDHLAAAPEFFVVCLDVRRVRLLLERRGEACGIRGFAALLFGITDASLFAQSLVVAAESVGLGACFIGGVQNAARAIADLLSIPEGVMPLYGLTLGRPAHKGSPKPRLPTRLVVHEGRYRDPSPDDLDLAFEAMAPTTRSGDWLNPLRKYFGVGGVMDGREADLAALVRDQGILP